MVAFGPVGVWAEPLYNLESEWNEYQMGSQSDREFGAAGDFLQGNGSLQASVSPPTKPLHFPLRAAERIPLIYSVIAS